MAPILLRHRYCAADPDQVDLCIRRLPDEREVTAQGPSREPPGLLAGGQAGWPGGGPRGEAGGGLRVIGEYVCSWPGLVRV